jgi:formate/nitrite transporter FocA (FNT family)
MMADTDGVPGDGDRKEVEKRQAAPARILHKVLLEQGEEELNRPAKSLFWSGVAAGLAIHASIIAMGALHGPLPKAAWGTAIVDLGYVLGFVIVVLGRLQLFTESTITAVLPLVTTPSLGAVWRTLRLWGIVLLGNLIGTFVVALLSTRGGLATAEQIAGMVAVSSSILDHSAWTTFLHAVPAGFLIAAIPWVLPSAKDSAIFVIVAITYVVALGNFGHVVAGSDEAFLLLLSGHATLGQVLTFLVPTLFGNIVGGSGLFAVLAHAQVEAEI